MSKEQLNNPKDPDLYRNFRGYGVRYYIEDIEIINVQGKIIKK